MQLGLIGLGTMGANLARNAARNGATVAVYNRTPEVTDDFIKEFGDEGDFKSAKGYKELVESLDAPRAIVLMVKSGTPVDAVIKDLLPHLEKGDTIIDAGNSHYPDTDRREVALKEKGIHFIGMGVSGGEEGALYGPSMMPGGEKAAYEQFAPLFEKMAADDGKGGKCVAHVGPGGAGHFVKMVHNGIEYGIMQLIAESYAVLKNIGGYSNKDLAETFDIWKEGDDLDSFLVEITADIFKKEDDQGSGDLIDAILDRAGQKGTGKWTTFAAMDYGVAIPTITAAVDARIISGSTALRQAGQGAPVALDEADPVPQKEKLRTQVRTALGLSIIATYNQGFELIRQASEEEGWGIDLAETARIWRGGCIIRSVLLNEYEKHYKRGDLSPQLLRSWFDGEHQLNWRRVVTLSTSRGVAVPAMAASLAYYDALRTERLPQNVIQAQRDYFGAHTYERRDKDGKFHTEW